MNKFGLKLNTTKYSWEWCIDDGHLEPSHHPSRPAYVSIGYGRMWYLNNESYFYLEEENSRDKK